jgi:hypothetical protein
MRRHTTGILVVSGVLASALLSARPASAQPGEPPPAEAPPAEAPAAPPPAPEAAPPVAAPMAPPPAVAPGPAPAATPPVGDVAPPPPPFKLETTKGNAFRLGILLQPQFTGASSANAALSGWGLNLILRRTRILVGGTLYGVFDYFLDTDFANLGVGTPSSTTDAMGVTTYMNTKSIPGMNIQDAFATYHPFGDVFKVDAGYMLPPIAHNGLQGAGTLYSVDYYTYTFRSETNNPNAFNNSANPVGRDLGVQLRGLLLGGHLEYRAGLFQGLRQPQTATDVASHNFFRFVGRLQINLLDPETGFFYAGTYLGTKRIVSLGGSVDIQDSYRYFAGDVFVDYPVGPGLFTLQANVGHWDGNTFITVLPSQTAVMSEVGFLFGQLALAPIFRFDYIKISPDAAASTNTHRIGAGLSLFTWGHNSNLKAFYFNEKASNEARAANQVVIQWQLYFF